APEPALVAALHARRKAERAVRLEPAAAGLPRRAAPALAAAAFAAFALLLTLLWRPERSDPVERLADMLVRGEVWERVAPLETNALPGLVARAQAPLHEELQAVVRDARAAAESVIESCLPPRVRKDFAPAPPEAAPRRR
ncbi:MAG: hypothetical protein J7M29_12765, partial [Verrucomicrobia bacterium]|nr:hypothetical protein [Verrucomicrobiota bacterium]